MEERKKKEEKKTRENNQKHNLDAHFAKCIKLNFSSFFFRSRAGNINLCNVRCSCLEHEHMSPHSQVAEVVIRKQFQLDRIRLHIIRKRFSILLLLTQENKYIFATVVYRCTHIAHRSHISCIRCNLSSNELKTET